MIVVYLIIAILCLTFVQILSVKIQQSTRRNICAAIIDQLINDIQENDWYYIQNGSQCNLHGREKALLVAGLESLLGDGER